MFAYVIVRGRLCVVAYTRSLHPPLPFYSLKKKTFYSPINGEGHDHLVPPPPPLATQVSAVMSHRS